MFKRIALAFTFVIALGVASAATSTQAVAHGCGYGGYGYRSAYYPGYAPYYAYPAYPRVAYYPGSFAPVYPVYYGGRPYRHHHHDGISISFGF